MVYQTIISCQELLSNLHTSNWVVIDCRFDLSDPAWGEQEYRELHIPGAVFADLNKDLSAPINPTTGRHPLPDPYSFVLAMSRLGINKDSQVIAYDATSGSFAARLWFLLNMYGFHNVAVLDGGFPQWMKLGYDYESGWEENPAGDFSGSPDLSRIVTSQEVLQNLTKREFLLVDARSAERYAGKVEPIDPIAGHIPGAVNRFHGADLAPDGLMLPPEKLKSEFLQLFGAYLPQDIVFYCGSGVTSAFHLLAMAVAGLPQPRLYAGSWSEWIRDPNRPIVQKETSW